MFKNKISAVVWDWNGTLLNDLELCVETINVLLKNRNLPLLTSSKYREVFSFPVKDYYEKTGFDFTKEVFAVPAREFIDLYNQNVGACGLFPEARFVLDYLMSKKIRQFVLSAMKQDMLEATLKHNGISDYFEMIAGLDDHYAVSKVEQGRRLLAESGINKTETFIVGDTLHDFEVATELGIGCILIADGHQSKERLIKSGAMVLDSIAGLLKADGLSMLV